MGIIVGTSACGATNPQTKQTIFPSSKNIEVNATQELIPSFTQIIAGASTITPTMEPCINTWVHCSPNGDFTATIEGGYPADNRIVVTDNAGNVIWTIPNKYYYWQGDPFPNLHIANWSSDSESLYFYYSRGCEGCGCILWWDGWHLQRLNMETGEVVAIIPGDEYASFSFGFSPDLEKIAYIKGGIDPLMITIRNLSNGIQYSVLAEFGAERYRADEINWSPDGRYVAFRTLGDSTILFSVLNVDTMWVKNIIEYPFWDFDFIFEGWTADGNLQLLDQNTDQRLYFNPANGEIIPYITSTITP